MFRRSFGRSTSSHVHVRAVDSAVELSRVINKRNTRLLSLWKTVTSARRGCVPRGSGFQVPGKMANPATGRGRRAGVGGFTDASIRYLLFLAETRSVTGNQEKLSLKREQDIEGGQPVLSRPLTDPAGAKRQARAVRRRMDHSAAAGARGSSCRLQPASASATGFSRWSPGPLVSPWTAGFSRLAEGVAKAPQARLKPAERPPLARATTD
jgi:hypothetical protein